MTSLSDLDAKVKYRFIFLSSFVLGWLIFLKICFKVLVLGLNLKTQLVVLSKFSLFVCFGKTAVSAVWILAKDVQVKQGCAAQEYCVHNQLIARGSHYPPIYLNWIFPILQFINIEFDELDSFPSLKPTGYFFQFKLIFFSSFMARVKYFDGPCLTIYSLSTIYRDIHYQFLVWWIHYSHCYESKR